MPGDVIRLTGLSFYGHHGVNPEERQLGQRFVVDLEIRLDLAPAGRSDDLTDTINYAEVYRLVRTVVEGPSVALIETVADRIAAVVLAQTVAQSVRICVAKPWAPVKGMVTGQVSIEIERSRPD